MDRRDLVELLENVAKGTVGPQDAAERIQVDTVSDLGFAQVDNARGLRQCVSEIIYGTAFLLKSHTKWFAVPALPPLPTTKICLSFL